MIWLSHDTFHLAQVQGSAQSNVVYSRDRVVHRTGSEVS